jgi:hypothetical protein
MPSNTPYVFNANALYGAMVAQQNAINQAYNEYKDLAMPKKDLSPSQMTYTLQIPEDLLTKSLESIDRELEERASALSEIAKLLEVVEETDSLIRHHISNLRTAASLSERKRAKKPLPYPGLSEQEPAGGPWNQLGAGQPVEAAEWTTVPALSQQGQG